MKSTLFLSTLSSISLASGASAQDMPRVEPIERSQQTYPNISPDGRHLLYSSGGDFELNLFLRNLASGEITQVTDNAFEDSAASWSPDGKTIVFQRQYSSDDPARDIWILNIEGGTERNLTSTPTISEQHPRFSSDGQSVYFDSDRHADDTEGNHENYEIYRVPIRGGETQRLTANKHWDLYPTPSPDGDQMLWVRALPIQDKEDTDYDIFVMNLDSGETANLSDHVRYDTSPDWSPNGEWIVFASDRMSSFRGRTDIYLVRPDGSDLRRLTDNGGTSMAYTRPRFSPDGCTIVASRVVAGRSDIVRLDLEGKDRFPFC